MATRGPLANPVLAQARWAGWILPALGLVLVPALWLVDLAWAHLSAGTAPRPPALAITGLVIAGAAFVLAGSIDLEPAHPPGWYRPVIWGLLLLGSAGAALSAGRFLWALGLGLVAAAGAARVGETLGRCLAPLLRADGEAVIGDWSRQGPETRRTVLEIWVACALALVVAPGGPTAALCLALTGAGGLALAAGSQIVSVRHRFAAQGFDWSADDLARAWRGVAGVSVLVLAVATPVPGPRPALARRFAQGVIGFVGWLVRGPAGHSAQLRSAPSSSAASVALVSTAAAAPPVAAGHPGWLNALLLALVIAQEYVIGYGVWIVAAIVAYILIRHVLSYGADPRVALRRLLLALRHLFDFLRWLLGLPPVARERAWDPGGPSLRPDPERAHRGGLLDPRRAIRAGYRRFLRRALEAGLARLPAESPTHFAARLARIVAAAAAEAGDLTGVYEEARYSDHALGRGHVGRARRALGRVLAVLRRRTVTGKGGLR